MTPERLRILAQQAREQGIPPDDALSKFKAGYEKFVKVPPSITFTLDIPLDCVRGTLHKQIYRVTTRDVYRILQPTVDVEPVIVEQNAGPDGVVNYYLPHENGRHYSLAQERLRWSWAEIAPLEGDLSELALTPKEFGRMTGLVFDRVMFILECMAACKARRVVF